MSLHSPDAFLPAVPVPTVADNLLELLRWVHARCSDTAYIHRSDGRRTDVDALHQQVLQGDLSALHADHPPDVKVVSSVFKRILMQHAPLLPYSAYDSILDADGGAYSAPALACTFSCRGPCWLMWRVWLSLWLSLWLLMWLWLWLCVSVAVPLSLSLCGCLSVALSLCLCLRLCLCVCARPGALLSRR